MIQQIKYFILLQVLFSCSVTKNKVITNTIDVFSNVNGAQTKEHLIKKLFYRAPNIIDSIYFYEKGVKNYSVNLIYDSLSKLVIQQERFVVDTFLNKEIFYKYDNKGMVNPSSNPTLFFNSNKIATLKIDDNFNLLDDISFDIENILFNVTMKNEILESKVKDKVKSYNTNGNFNEVFPCEFNRLKTYSQYGFFPSDIFLDSVQISIIDKKLVEFNIFYRGDRYLKQKIIYEKKLLSKLEITVKDDKNKERLYYTSFFYNDTKPKATD